MYYSLEGELYVTVSEFAQINLGSTPKLYCTLVGYFLLHIVFIAGAVAMFSVS